jgi:SPASM domain peptide maturase of grasp-with-spasm system
MKKNFKLFAGCFIVKGYLRSMICDTQQNDYHFIPNHFSDIVDYLNSYDKINEPLINHEEIESFTQFITENNLGFFHDNINENISFQNIDLKWETYSLISNIHIEIGENSVKHFSLIPDVIAQLKTENVAFFFNNRVTYKNLIEVLNLTKNSRLKYLELYIPYSDWMKPEEIKKILTEYRYILQFFIHSAPFDIKEDSITTMVVNLNYSQNEICYEDDMEFTPYFNNNLDMFLESINFNVYFNKALFISENGDLKNKYNSNVIFGNLKSNIDVIKLVESSEYRELSNIDKDKIDICKECEFRRICIDKREPLKRNSDEWYQKTECVYNPYICKWSHEDGYLNLSECGVISNNFNFLIDHERINQINLELWGE